MRFCCLIYVLYFNEAMPMFLTIFLLDIILLLLVSIIKVMGQL